MDLSIVIVNYKNLEVTLKCIKSIELFTKELTYEIIVIDNTPNTNSKTCLLENANSSLTYIESENLGFGRANNKGMSKAKGDFILLLNSDTELIDNSLLACINELKRINGKTQKPAMLGCQLLNQDLSYQHSYFPFLNDSIFLFLKCSNPIFYRIFGISKYYQSVDTTMKVGDISGAFMLLNKEIYNVTKGFDEDFFMYYEESDWCRNRIRNHFNIYYFPYAKIIHIGASSTTSDRANVQKLISQGLFWYKKGKIKYYRFLCAQFINVMTFIGLSLINKNYLLKIGAILKAFPYWTVQMFHYKTKMNSNTKPLIYKHFLP